MTPLSYEKLQERAGVLGYRIDYNFDTGVIILFKGSSSDDSERECFGNAASCDQFLTRIEEKL